MAKKTIVFKFHSSCEKCKRRLMTEVSKLYGISKLDVDEAKDTLSVTGEADPFLVIKRVKKKAKCAEVVRVGSPKRPEPVSKAILPTGEWGYLAHGTHLNMSIEPPPPPAECSIL